MGAINRNYQNRTPSILFLYVYVIITGASVMALEISASRFLAPYFGTSMIVWANIIGLILLSLTVGYFVGGRLADKKPNMNILMSISLFAGILSSLLPLWGHWIFPALSAGILDTPIFTILFSFIAILLVFAPPVFLLAMVSPFALRLVSGDPQQVGKIAGNLYAFSTFGSLLGTFGTAFGTIPFWGTKETLFFWSALLIVVSASGIRNSVWGKISYTSMLLPIFLYVQLHGSEKTGKDIIWSKDTLYQYVQVIRQSDGTMNLVYNEGGGVQSIYHPNDALTKDDYYDDYLALPYLVPKAKEVLVLGSAGGTIPRLLAKYVKPNLPDLHITGVEIDPDVIPLDYQYFGLQQDDATIVNQDARVFMHQTDKKYDIVIVDAYSQQIYIPFHLSTFEFFQEINSKLNNTGMIALNVNAVDPHSKILSSFEKTVQAVFPDTYVLKARGAYNYVIIGSKQPLALNQPIPANTNVAVKPIIQHWTQSVKKITDQQVASGMLFTDNRAPIEMMTDSMIFNFMKK